MITCFYLVGSDLLVRFRVPTIRLNAGLNLVGVITLTLQMFALTALCSACCQPAGNGNPETVSVRDSKWTLENILSAKDIELPEEGKAARGALYASEHKALAEAWFIAGDYDRALSELQLETRMLEAASKRMKSGNNPGNLCRRSERPVDQRLESCRYARAFALLKRGRLKDCRFTLLAILKQQLLADEQLELKGRNKCTSSEKCQDDFESDGAFQARYRRLRTQLSHNLKAALLHRARLLYWQSRLFDSARLVELALGLNGPRNATREGSNSDFADEVDLLTALMAARWPDRPVLKDPGCEVPTKPEYRVHLLNGFTALASGKLEPAEISLETALEHLKHLAPAASVRGQTEEALKLKEDEIMIRFFLAQARFKSGKIIEAYDGFNDVYEQARRAIEGKRDGLFFLAISSEALEGMHKSVMARLHDEIDSFAHRQGNSSREGEKNGEKLAMDLYHVGYQFKIQGHESKARQLLWNSARVFEKYAPSNKNLLSMTLYDLAESYSWSEYADVASAVFSECARLRKNEANEDNYARTLSSLARAYMANGESERASACMGQALQLLVEIEQKKGDRVKDIMAGIRRSRHDSVPQPLKAPVMISSPDMVRQSDAPSLSGSAPDLVARSAQPDARSSIPDVVRQLNTVAQKRLYCDPSVLPTIDDFWQVLADAYSRGKYFDEARLVSQSLLKTRNADDESVRQQRLDSLWQLAYISSVSYQAQSASALFDEMISQYGQSGGRPLADWYYTHGVLADTLGLPNRAIKDFKNAISQYRKQLSRLDPVKDSEQVEQIGWMIADLRYELQAKERCPEERRDYAHAYPCYRWNRSHFPLKICLDTSKEHGFGPQLIRRFKEGIAHWLETPGLDIPYLFVEDRELADIYFERVSNYDLIPFGSGGAAVATFLDGNKRARREIDRVHLRLFCESYDNDELSNYAEEHLYTLALHEFGHALGLGHSPSGRDIMYWKSAMKSLSSRDKATLLKLYSCRVKQKS